jgi:hypothetical protein
MRCEQDVVFWVNQWGWTYDPRETVSTLPFLLFPRQEVFLRWMTAREAAQEDGLVEKSRDMGVSWLCCAYALHGWLFREGCKCGFGSRKLDLVDKLGDPDCLFEKLRFLLRHLPAWMRPPGFRWKRHDHFCKLVNPANGATITGEGGDNIGRGGRASLYFVDEAAFLAHPQQVDAALSQTTRCRIDVSTPNGTGNPFYRKRHSGAIPVFTFHWRDDPRKDEAWYAREKARLGDPALIAQEIDLDYAASVEGVTIPAAWVRAAVRLKLPTSGAVVAGLDIAEEGSGRTVLICRRGPVVLTVVDWGQSNTTQTAWRTREEAQQQGVTALHYDVVGVGAGVKGSFESSESTLPFRAHAINGGETPTEARWPNGKTSRELFLNLRAELWWNLRQRFERAYEFREQGIAHKPEEMISIPDHGSLIADLSLPLYFRTETGKIKLESKTDMRKRGVKSPDFGDALAYAFAPLAGDWQTAAQAAHPPKGTAGPGVW